MANRWDRYPLDGTLSTGIGSYRTWAGTPSLPDVVDLRSDFGPVADIGPEVRASAAFAVAAVSEFILRRTPHRGTFQRISPRYIYYFGRSIHHLEDTPDAGISILDAMSGVSAYGGCPEALWPWDPKQYRQKPTQACRDAAIEFAFINIRDPWATAEGVMRSVADSNPVIFRYVGPPDLLRQAAATGRMPQPSPGMQADLEGPGHAMVVVGYDRRDRTLIVRNCWGADWGMGGHVIMPLDMYNATSPNAVAMGPLTALTDVSEVEQGVPARPAAVEQTSDIRSQIRKDLGSDMDAAMKAIKDRFKNN